MDEITVTITEIMEDVDISVSETMENIEITVTEPLDGREVELRNTGEFVQWKYAGESSWTNLIEISDLITQATPGGNDKAIQYNNGGVLSGDDEFRYDNANKTVVIGQAGILPAAKLAVKANVDNYAQITFQNSSQGYSASTDYVATADNGDDLSYYVDLGINSSQYDNNDYSLYGPNDAYLLNTGGNLILNATDEAAEIILAVGGSTNADKIGAIDSDGINLESGKTYRINGVEIPSGADIDRVELQNIEVHGTGLVSGGAITLTTGIQFNIAAGVGYISNGTTDLIRVTWSNKTGIETAVNGTNFICIDSTGAAHITGTEPDSNNYITLGYIFTGASNTVIVELVNTPRYCSDLAVRANTFAIQGVRALVEDGTTLSEGVTPLTLSVAEGKIHVNLDVYTIDSRTTFKKMYNTADYGWVFDTGSPNTVNPAVYNDPSKNYGSALVAMTSGYWKKSLVFRTPAGTMYAIYGQAEYATEELAKSAPIPTMPDDLGSVAVYVATIVCCESDTSIGNRIYDVRPYLPRVFGYGSSSSGVSVDHGSLTGLGDDDHTQYFNTTRGDARYAPAGKGVTNGDSHNHDGGDGAQISYTKLGDIPSTFAPASHGDAAHSVTYIQSGDSRLTDDRYPKTHATAHVTGGTDIIANAVAGGASGLMTGADKTKLDGIASGAEVNIQSDWNSVSGDSLILNKPTSMTPTTHASSHASGQSDAIKLDDLATPDDNTDLNATTDRHGLLLKLGGGTSNFLRADGTWSAPPAGTNTNTRIFTFVLHRGENATTGTNKTNKLVVDKSYTINKAYAYATTGPTGAALIFDINVNGSTIWSTQANRLQIAAGSNSGSQTSFNTTSLVEGDILSIDIDQIGSTVAGSDITVVLRGDI